MKNLMNICRKELKKVFQDKRMIFSIIILPGLMLFLVYAVMGVFMSSQSDKVQEHKSILYVEKATEDFMDIFDVPAFNIEIKTLSDEMTVQKVKDGILAGTIDGYIEFIPKTTSTKESVKVYYNSGENNSSAAYVKISSALSAYNKYLQSENNIDPDIIEVLAPEVIIDHRKASAKAMGYIIPMLIVIFIFASALSVCAEAIAGEKERNTLATLLVTPIKRSDVILGKTFSCLIITICSSISSFIGLMASLPMMGDAFGTNGISLSYGFLEIIGIFMAIILIALYGVVMILSASVYAKNIKEASALSMPIYFLGIFIPIFTGMQERVPSEIYHYAIPFYNAIVCLKGLITLDISFVQLLVTFGSSIVYIGLLILFLTNLFKKESILFKK